MPQIIPIRDLKDTTQISAMCHETTEPIYITKNGYGDMVIMSMEAFEKNLLMQDAFAKIEEAESDIRQKRVKDARASLKTLRDAHGV